MEEFGREMYKIVKQFNSMQKEAQKEKGRRVADSKGKKEEEMAAVKVAHTIQGQIQDFKVTINRKRMFDWTLSAG